MADEGGLRSASIAFHDHPLVGHADDPQVLADSCFPTEPGRLHQSVKHHHTPSIVRRDHETIRRRHYGLDWQQPSFIP